MSEKDLSRAEDGDRQLLCEHCSADLLETGDGVLVRVAESRGYEASPRYDDVFVACKSICQEMMLIYLGLEKWKTHTTSIDDAANPLAFPRWDRETSRMLETGRLSTTAARKLAEAKRKIARAAARIPTAEDVARYRWIRLLNGL